jgi:6-phosphogluconolactonase
MSRGVGNLDQWRPCVRIARDSGAQARAVAEHVVGCADRGIVQRGAFRLALSGGATPKLFFETLAAAPYAHSVEWARVEIFLVDERLVPSEDPASNWRVLSEALLSRLPCRPAAAHRWRTEIPLEAALEDYRTILKRLPRVGENPPALDLIVLGLGGDGHTASLFPGTAALEEETAWVAAGRAPEPPQDRLTMTLPLLNAAREAAFLVAGETKAAIVRRILSSEGGELPASRVHPAGELLWFLDPGSAAELTSSPS